MHDRNMSKRLSDMRLLCRTIARICDVRGGMDVTRISTEACTLEEVHVMFFFAMKHLLHEPNKKNSRPSHWTWVTMVKHIQKCRKNAVYKDIFPLPNV
jgi:hypothetical protein